MINTNFSLNYNINLMETAVRFGNSKKFSVTFDPDRYSAVKIKFKPGENMKQVTVSMFSTGKTIITGAETLEEIVFAYKAIVTHVNEHASKIKVSKTAVSDVFDFIEGWNVVEAVEYFRKQGVKPFIDENDPYRDCTKDDDGDETDEEPLTTEEIETHRRRYFPTAEEQIGFRKMFHDLVERN